MGAGPHLGPHRLAAEARAQEDARAVRRVAVAGAQRREHRLARRLRREDRREAAARRGDLREARVPVVGVAAADEAEPVAASEGVAHEVAGHRLVDQERRVERLAAPVHRGHLRHRLEHRVRREGPVGGHRPPGRVVREGQRRLPAQRLPELCRVVRRLVERAHQRALVREVEHVAVPVEPARPLEAEQGHEAPGLVEALRSGLDLAPHVRATRRGRGSPSGRGR